MPNTHVALLGVYLVQLQGRAGVGEEPGGWHRARHTLRAVSRAAGEAPRSDLAQTLCKPDMQIDRANNFARTQPLPKNYLDSSPASPPP